jgi:hypothetical protein
VNTRIVSSLALVALLAGCSGSASTVPANSKQSVPSGGVRTVKTTGGPGTTSLTYLSTYAPYGPCSGPGLTIMAGYFPVTSLSFAANDGPPLVVSNCHFSTPHYVNVTLGTPAYGSPFVRQTDYTVTVDSTNKASVTATWTDLGPTLPGTPAATATVSFTIGDPDTGGGL